MVLIGYCGHCEQKGKKVMKRTINPNLVIECCADCAMGRRAINNASGVQKRADKPPYDTGEFRNPCQE